MKDCRFAMSITRGEDEDGIFIEGKAYRNG